MNKLDAQKFQYFYKNMTFTSAMISENASVDMHTIMLQICLFLHFFYAHILIYLETHFS